MMSNPETLPTNFLPHLIAEIDHPDFSGILLGGSYARGDATKLSDVDIACIVPDDTKLRRKRFVYTYGKLVSIGVKSIEGIREQLAKPDTAIWVARGYADCRILLDKDGSVTSLLEEVRAFTWEPRREAANERASFRLMLAAEMAQKVANEIGKEDDLAISFAVARLLAELTEIVAIGDGVLIKSDNTYYRQVQEAAGPDSSWSYHHRFLTGVDTEGEDDISPRGLGFGALTLYRETVELLRPIMKPDHLEVVEETIRLLNA